MESPRPVPVRYDVHEGNPEWPTDADMRRDPSLPQGTCDSAETLAAAVTVDVREVEEYYTRLEAARTRAALAGVASEATIRGLEQRGLIRAVAPVARRSVRATVMLPPESRYRALLDVDMIRTLPEEIQQLYSNAASAVLMTLFAPFALRRLTSRHRRRYLLDRRHLLVAPVPMELFLRLPTLRTWGAQAIHYLYSRLEYVRFDAGRVVAYRGEPSSSVYILMGGTARCRPSSAAERAAARSSGAGVEAGGWLHTASAPSILNESAFLTHDIPWQYTWVAHAHGPCDVWVLDMRYVRELMGHTAAPPEAAGSVLSAALQVAAEAAALRLRHEHLARHLALSTLTLRSAVPGLDTAPGALVVELLGGAAPCVFSPGTPLAVRGCPIHNLTIIMHGRASRDGVPIAPHRRQAAPWAVEPMDFLLNFDSTADVQCDSFCYAYAVPAQVLDGARGSFSKEHAAFMRAVCARRQAALQRAFADYLPLLEQVPLLRQLPWTVEALMAFGRLMEARVVPGGTTVCSRSAFADGLVFLVRGELRAVGRMAADSWGEESNGVRPRLDSAVGSPARALRSASGLRGRGAQSAKADDVTTRIVEPGTCIGWTCVVPHRWAVAVTAARPAEMFEVPASKLCALLRRHMWLSQVQHQARLLFFPNAFPLDETRALREALPPHLVFYPVSANTRVDVHDRGFSAVHQSQLTADRNQIIAAEAAEVRLRPEPVRQIDGCGTTHGTLWIPARHKPLRFSVQ